MFMPLYCIGPLLKKKFVSCVAVAQIMATRADANFFFFFRFFFFGKKITKKFWEKKIEKKEVPVSTNILTRPLDRKQTFFEGWPRDGWLSLRGIMR